MSAHSRAHDQGGSTVDIDELIGASGCRREYEALEARLPGRSSCFTFQKANIARASPAQECMGEHDRVWAKCQRQVHDLKRCGIVQATKKAESGRPAAKAKNDVA